MRALLNWATFIANPWTVTVGGGVAVAGLSAAFEAGRRFWVRVWAAMRAKPFVPTETLRIIQDIHQSHWGLGSFQGISSMNLTFEGQVTDISGRPNQVVRVEIRKPPNHARIVMLTEGHSANRIQVLRPFESIGIHAMFFVQPVVSEEGKPWRTTLIFVDQYGNRHKVKDCVFRGLNPPPQVPKSAP